MQVRGLTRRVTGTTKCLYHIPFLHADDNYTFCHKTYHFLLVNETFFVLLVAEDLYLSRLRMNVNSRRTILYTISRLWNVSSYSTWYQGFNSIWHLSLNVVPARLMWNWPRISASTSLFVDGSFVNSSFPVPEMVVSYSNTSLHLKFLKEQTNSGEDLTFWRVCY